MRPPAANSREVTRTSGAAATFTHPGDEDAADEQAGQDRSELQSVSAAVTFPSQASRLFDLEAKTPSRRLQTRFAATQTLKMLSC